MCRRYVPSSILRPSYRFTQPSPPPCKERVPSQSVVQMKKPSRREVEALVQSRADGGAVIRPNRQATMAPVSGDCTTRDSTAPEGQAHKRSGGGGKTPAPKTQTLVVLLQARLGPGTGAVCGARLPPRLTLLCPRRALLPGGLSPTGGKDGPRT